MSNSQVVEVEGKRLTLTNLDKVLYPATGFTKGEVIDYAARIAPALLPHLKDRPVTMKRYPDGVDGEYFYEKNAPKHRPDWVQTVSVWSRHNRRHINFLLVQDLPTLIWLSNLASIEIHPSLALGSEIKQPTMMVFDLDPGPPANIIQCAQVGIWLHDIFSHWGLESFPKTSGSKGLQVYVPLNTPVTYEQTKLFAHEQDLVKSGASTIDATLEVQVLALADSYETLISDAGPRKMSPAQAEEIIVKSSGKRYDSMVVDAFVKAFGQRAEGAGA